MKNVVSRSLRTNYRFWLLAGFLVLVFLIGGGARDDIVSLILLRPAAVVFLAVGLWGMRRAEWEPFKGLFLLVGAAILLVLLHLLPLPPAIWTSLPGRQLLVEAGNAAGVPLGWRPLTVTPARTWNALFSLLLPLTALVLMIRVPEDRRRNLVLVLIGIGLIDVLVSVFQVVGSPDGPFYFYRVTNNGAAVGLFSNRNHNATFLLLLFPLLAFVAGQWLLHSKLGKSRRAELKFADVRPLFLLAFGFALIPMILVAGSRAGIIYGVVALLLSPLLLARRKGRRGGYLAMFAGKRGAIVAALVLGISALVIYFSRAVALQRLVRSGGEDETRLQVWGPIARMAWQYFPFGSGVGSFIEVFQRDEALAVLKPTYVNHAHNDFLEVLLTAGVPGLLLIAAAIAYWAWHSWRLIAERERPDVVQLQGRLGAITVFLLALTSVADYPLRAPSLACFLIVGLVWLTDGTRARNSGVG